MTKNYVVAIAGATGLVGRKMLKVLEERNFPVGEIKLLASSRSAGKSILFKGKKYKVQELTPESFEGVDIALFSAGGDASKKFAPEAAKRGCIVIDNSSAFRLDENVPLVVPEVNPNALRNHKNIIANPNCSTIQMVVALNPIHHKYGLKRIICSTYQSISGAGQKGLDKLRYETTGDFSLSDDGYPIAFNAIFHGFESNGFTNEENKMIKETRKIMEIPNLNISVTCVRLPILGGHAESVNVETNNKFEIEDVKNLLAKSDGIILQDDTTNNIYPTPQKSNDTDPVYIGRIRRDNSVENGLHLWVVADNIRKGAATNAVQIAEKMIELDLI